MADRDIGDLGETFAETLRDRFEHVSNERKLHEENMRRLNRRFYKTFFRATRDALAIVGLVTVVMVALYRFKLGILSP